MVSINLSGQSLGDTGFLTFVLDELNRSTIAPARLCFEITETAAITNLGAATEFISKLRHRGCRFALDDFGSGLSSFSYLKTLSVDFLKIDGNFVRNMLNDPLSYSIVDSINQIGHVMGLTTIAEFVESTELLSVLRDIQIDYAQGYYIGEPELLV
jgi:EAL domain-containing protein (putative c-di-GMP-specific phosphodiesterase class I)